MPESTVLSSAYPTSIFFFLMAHIPSSLLSVCLSVDLCSLYLYWLSSLIYCFLWDSFSQVCLSACFFQCLWHDTDVLRSEGIEKQIKKTQYFRILGRRSEARTETPLKSQRTFFESFPAMLTKSLKSKDYSDDTRCVTVVEWPTAVWEFLCVCLYIYIYMYIYIYIRIHIRV